VTTVQAARAIKLLERIAVALERQNVIMAAVGGAAESDACVHPLEDREDLSTMGHPRWRCKCGFTFGE
jgi:hypothetical protein